jgi:hypothetical protein
MRLEKHKFLDHLEARGSRIGCPCCDTTSWEMLIEEPVNLQDQRVMEFGLARLAGGLAVAVVAMVCGNCGFVRMHSVDKLIQTGCPR